MIFSLYVEDATRVPSCLIGNLAVRNMGSEMLPGKAVSMHSPSWDSIVATKIKLKWRHSEYFKIGPLAHEKSDDSSIIPSIFIEISFLLKNERPSKKY
jgi:hypothetical protein